jgi:hypothetical protein
MRIAYIGNRILRIDVREDEVPSLAQAIAQLCAIGSPESVY